MLCFGGLKACVGSGEVNITKLLQKEPDGSFQSAQNEETCITLTQ